MRTWFKSHASRIIESLKVPVFFKNIKDTPVAFWNSFIRHGMPTSERSRSQAVFGNFFLHIHATHTHENSLRLTSTWGLGVSLVSQFIILAATGIMLMLYYTPSVDLAYGSIKDLHYVVPTGRFIRNIHRWATNMMVFTVILHMARVFYTASYKSPREFNWLVGMALFVVTLALSFTGYILPWDQLAYWAATIGANIAASPNELVYALGFPGDFRPGDLMKTVLLGGTEMWQDGLTRFYMFHVMLLPIVLSALMGVHIWRIRKDGGLGRPGGSPTTAGKGAETQEAVTQAPENLPQKTFGLMGIIPTKFAHAGQTPEGTVPSWPYLLRAEMLVFMCNMLILIVLGLMFDAPLKEMANPMVPENPAKAPWYFLGLQEMVSYSAFLGGVAIPTISLIGLAMIPYLDREREESGVWFSGERGKRFALWSLLVGSACAIVSVAFPVTFGWLRDWFPGIPQIVIVAINPGSLLTAAYALWSLWVMKKTGSTRLGAISLFTCFLVGFLILTYVGTYLRGPNWDFYWSQSQWPTH